VMIQVLHWVIHVLGVDYGQRYGTWNFYNFWSGIGGALPDVLLLTAFCAWYRSNNCHVHRCWRLGKHPVGVQVVVVCRRHHPGLNGRITAADVEQLHQEASRR